MTPPSMPPQITMNVGARRVSVDELPDRRLGSALRAAGHDIAQKIDAVRCPVHKRAATQLRIHFDRSGNADLQYDSCCEKLGESIGRSLG